MLKYFTLVNIFAGIISLFVALFVKYMWFGGFTELISLEESGLLGLITFTTKLGIKGWVEELLTICDLENKLSQLWHGKPTLGVTTLNSQSAGTGAAGSRRGSFWWRNGGTGNIGGAGTGAGTGEDSDSDGPIWTLRGKSHPVGARNIGSPVFSSDHTSWGNVYDPGNVSARDMVNGNSPIPWGCEPRALCNISDPEGIGKIGYNHNGDNQPHAKRMAQALEVHKEVSRDTAKHLPTMDYNAQKFFREWARHNAPAIYDIPHTGPGVRVSPNTTDTIRKLKNTK